jgi:hypothetical protein
MKAYLMFPDRDFDLSAELPYNSEALTQDLGLGIVWDAMAKGDKRIGEVVKRALLVNLADPEVVTYRQEVLADCLANPTTTRQLYNIVSDSLAAERKAIWGLSRGTPQSVVYKAVDTIELFVSYLKQLREIAAAAAGSFSSPGFTRFFQMLQSELDDGYFKTVETHLAALRFRKGVLISAGLGPGFTSMDHVLRLPRAKGWRERLSLSRAGFSFEIPARDEAGAQILSDLTARALNLVANATGQAAQHIRSFMAMVASELAFYVGCLNLQEQLTAVGAPLCVPEPLAANELALRSDGLYDVGLALRVGTAVTGNRLRADGKLLVVVTGANQGGKSTFLRSMGLAQMMMQAGMFGPARQMSASVCHGVHTHFKREEDATMTSGKFDEELVRMSDIATRIRPGALLLCNESFASTNEQEGSDVAREIVHAMVDASIRVIFVTHMYELSRRLLADPVAPTLFLRAERLPDGQRTFKVVEGEPMATSYGEDSYRRIFGARPTIGDATAGTAAEGAPAEALRP